MKVLITLALLILSIPSISIAQTWYTANQVTMQWDAVTLMQDGTAIPAADQVRYQPYQKLNSVEIGTAIGPEITDTQKLYTFGIEGSYLLGVKALRYVSGVKVSESGISWSDNPAVCQGGNTFGVIFYRAPRDPIGLRFPS